MPIAGRGIVLRQIDRLFGEGTLTGLGDGPLLERYLTRRDEDAFEALVDLHGPMVLGLCRRMLRDPRDIEDAFQATFLVLVRKAPAIRDRDLLSSWLYGVAFRVARRARSRTLRRRDREANVGVPEIAAEPEPPERPEIDPMLDQELSRLPEKYRAPLVLCYLRGRTHEQAAEVLGCPVGTVRSRMARGRELLRKRLTRRGFAPTVLGALLSGDPSLPARLLVAAVPPPMAAATVRAAVGFGSSSIIKAGAAAASSAILARGVLATMKIAQLKWIGTAVLAAGLSAGGVVAVGSASVSRQEAVSVGKPTAVVGSDEPKKAQAPPPDSATKATMLKGSAPQGIMPPTGLMIPAEPLGVMEARLKSLEEKIDFLTSRSAAPADRDSASALGSQLIFAIKEYDRMNQLVERQAIEARLADEARARVVAIVARVEALDQETQDERDRLKLERRRKAAMLDKARAEVEVAIAVVARNRRLNTRKPDMVGPDDAARDELELKVATAQSRVAEVEVAEVDLRIKQVERRREGLADVVERARRARGGK